MAKENLLMAARQRLLDGDNETIAGSMLEKPDGDDQVDIIDDAYARSAAAAIDAIELELAGLVSLSEAQELLDPETYHSMLWMAEADPVDLPNPMPRDLVFYLATAWVEIEHYSTVTDGIDYILANFTFS